jgi:hypothetical protein
MAKQKHQNFNDPLLVVGYEDVFHSVLHDMRLFGPWGMKSFMTFKGRNKLLMLRKKEGRSANGLLGRY